MQWNHYFCCKWGSYNVGHFTIIGQEMERPNFNCFIYSWIWLRKGFTSYVLLQMVRFYSVANFFNLYCPLFSKDKKVIFFFSFRCLKESPEIRRNVTFHFVFPSTHLPHGGLKSSQHASNKHYVENCQTPPIFKTTYRRALRMNYPINVLRNVAIETSATQYVLHASLQVMPSIGVIPISLKVIAKGIDDFIMEVK